MSPRIALPAVLMAVVVVLTGCSGAGSAPASPSVTGGTQSVSAACDVVRSSVADAAEQLQSLDASDPQASISAMSGVAAELGDAIGAVDNADVAAVLPGLQAGFSQAAEVLQAIAGGDLSKLPALQQATSDIQASFADFAELCPAP